MDVTPLGFVRLRRAANLVGAALYGSNWRPVHEVPAPLLVLWPLVEWDAPFTLIGGLDPADELLPEVERVFELIAKRAASGKLACVRFTYTGDVEGVDPAKWRSLGWRNFFDFDLRKGDRGFGRITLEVPAFDERGKQVLDWREKPITVWGRFDIFVEQEGVEGVVAAALPAEPPAGVGTKTESVPSSKVRARPKTNEIVAGFRKWLALNNVRPSQDRFVDFVQRQGVRGNRDGWRKVFHKHFDRQQPGRPRSK